MKKAKKTTKRKIIEIDEDIWEFLQFLRVKEKHSTFKSFLEEILMKVIIDKKDLYDLFLKKKELEKKMANILDKD